MSFESRCANIGIFFSPVADCLHALPWIFRYKGTEGVPTANGVSLGCTEGVRQPSAICAKLGVPSAFRLPRLPCGTCSLRGEGIVKPPGSEKPQGFKQKGKELNSWLSY